MGEKEKIISEKLKAYKKKYYLNLVLRGTIIALALILSIFFVVNALEYSFRFGSVVRACLLFLLIVTGLVSMAKFVVNPLLKVLNIGKGLSNEDAARQIGGFFPEISDKLLNIIQLQNNQTGDMTLVNAGINQKSEGIVDFTFSKAVEVKENKKYLGYLIVPILLIILAVVISPSFITDSTTRIVKFQEDFEPIAPFKFDVSNTSFQAYKNEDYTVSLVLDGNAIPETAYLVSNERKLKMTSVGNGSFEYTFLKIQDNREIRFEAAGFNSKEFLIKVVNRPDLRNFNVNLNYPDYLGKKNERLNNVGNLQIPEGTEVLWQLKTLHAEKVAIKFGSDEENIVIQSTDNQIFEYNKRFLKSDIYNINLENEFSSNKELIRYKVDVIPDQFPQISLQSFQDTTLYSFIALSGNISDDYGISRLKLFYATRDTKAGTYKSINIPVNKSQNNQRYYYQWFLDSMDVAQGKEIKYYLQVWDNDGINGQKSAKTGIYNFKVPTKQELKDEIEKTTTETQKDIDNTLQEAKELKEQIEKAENKLKGKKELSWQDENELKEILKKREELNKAIEELKAQNKANDQKRERFSKQDKRIQEKVKQLQELMDQLLDEETKKLYEELQKLLENQEDIDDIQDVLEKLNNKEDNLEKELERTLELFKRMKFDHKLNEGINELNEQKERQEELNEKTQDKNEDTEELSQEQEQLQKDFEELQEELDELKELNQDLENPQSLPDTEQEEQDIEQQQQESKESLDNKKRKKSSQSQQKAQDQMQQMSQKLQQMQSSMEMNMMQENLDDLRDIVHNLLKLSFDQEALLDEFGKVKQSDPRFIELSQKQLKLKDDAKIVEDSLLSLANRVFQIASFVTREVGEMNNHMDKSMEAIKERKKPLAVSEQQFAMTSINNLALLLDDVLQQMQNAMADAMGKPQKGKGKQKSPSLGELQQQLNNKISDLKKSGKSGRQLSEELAKLAAEQQRIRQALQEMQKQNGQKDGGNTPGNGIPKKMEETEIDLVNKQITQETIRRQKEILTRLLEAEDALRERDKDEERKGETAKDYEKALPKAFEDYFKLKEQEIELLKTIPPKLYPYYKKEVSEYFKRIGNEPN